MTARNQMRIYWFLFIGGLAWTAYLFLSSPGVPVQDEIAHLLISRNAWNYPVLVLDVWGRPLNTVLYVLPSLGGLAGARILSIALSGMTVSLTARLTRQLDGNLWFLTPAFLWFQPWYNDLSYTAITEVPFAAILIAALYAWIRRCEQLAAFLVGVLVLVRYEAIVLVLALATYEAFRRNWVWSIVAFCPFAVYNLLSIALVNRLPADIFLVPKPTTLYGSGSLLHFVGPLVHRVGWPILALGSLALVSVAQTSNTRKVFFIYALYFLTHVGLFYFGLFASGGYVLFLLPLAPAFAISAAFGMQRLLRGLGCALTLMKMSSNWAPILSLGLSSAMLVVVVHVGLRTEPRPLDPEGATMEVVARWMGNADVGEGEIVSTHAWFFYFFDLPWSPEHGWAQPPSLNEMPAGSIVVWDRHYSERWGLSAEILSDSRYGWETLQTFGDGFAVVFRKLSN